MSRTEIDCLFLGICFLYILGWVGLLRLID